METTSINKNPKVYLLKAAPEDHSANKSLQEIETDKNQQQLEGHEETNEDHFITVLRTFGFESQLIPVVKFEYSNLDTLWRHLKHPAQHAGIVFSSPRCVSSILEAVRTCDVSKEWDLVLRYEWASKYIFCVGPSTLVKAKQLLSPINLDYLLTGKESHAESLAEKIVEIAASIAFTSPLLYPCGVQRRDILQNKLNDADVRYNDCIVYETVRNPSIEGLLHAALEAKIVAIGPTTKAALDTLFSSEGLTKAVYQCEDPTPEALVNVLCREIVLQKME